MGWVDWVRSIGRVRPSNIVMPLCSQSCASWNVDDGVGVRSNERVWSTVADDVVGSDIRDGLDR